MGVIVGDQDDRDSSVEVEWIRGELVTALEMLQVDEDNCEDN